MSENQNPPGRNSPPGMPRWVKLIVVMFIILVAVVIILHLMGFGFGSHGAFNSAKTIAGVDLEFSLFIPVVLTLSRP